MPKLATLLCLTPFFSYRTCRVNELTKMPLFSEVMLAGWMTNVRKVNKNFGFIVLRDSQNAKIQISMHDGTIKNWSIIFNHEIGNESVIQVKGIFTRRPPKDIKVTTSVRHGHFYRHLVYRRMKSSVNMKLKRRNGKF
jgi:aspartyl-tRNA synthetase